MPQYEYKTVPAPMVLSIKNEKEERAGIASFGNAINAEANDGWEFYSMETITTKEAAGCMPGSGSGAVKHHNMLVFRRKISKE